MLSLNPLILLSRTKKSEREREREREREGRERDRVVREEKGTVVMEEMYNNFLKFSLC